MVNEFLGKDIELKENDIQFSKNQDFSVTKDIQNLAQAITNRLSTIKGEYKLNTVYGSELNSDLGLPDNNFIISGVKGHVIECLNQEARIKSFDIIDVVIDNQTVNISLSIIAINSNKQFNMVYPLYLEV